jgi:hypothetical protein
MLTFNGGHGGKISKQGSKRCKDKPQNKYCPRRDDPSRVQLRINFEQCNERRESDQASPIEGKNRFDSGIGNLSAPSYLAREVSCIGPRANCSSVRNCLRTSFGVMSNPLNADQMPGTQWLACAPCLRQP